MIERLLHRFDRHNRCDPDKCDTASLEEDYGPSHPKARKFKPGTWDEPGRCICGAPLPPQRLWDRASTDWSNILCSKCGTGYVDEEEFFAIYDPERVAEMGGPGEWKVHSDHVGTGANTAPSDGRLGAESD